MKYKELRQIIREEIQNVMKEEMPSQLSQEYEVIVQGDKVSKPTSDPKKLAGELAYWNKMGYAYLEPSLSPEDKEIWNSVVKSSGPKLKNWRGINIIKKSR